MSYVLDILFKKIMDRRPAGASPAPVLVPPPPEPAQERESPRLPETGTVQLEWLDENDQYRRLEAKVHDRSRCGIALSVERGLNIGWPVVIAHGGTIYRGVVRHCRRGENDWRVGFQVVEDEQRRDDRYPFECAAEISWQADGETKRIPCSIHDANSGGVQIESESELPENATACLYYDGWRRFGSVAWSRRKRQACRSGIHFTGVPISDRSVDYDG